MNGSWNGALGNITPMMWGGIGIIMGFLVGSFTMGFLCFQWFVHTTRFDVIEDYANGSR